MAYTGNQENMTKPKLIYYDMGKEVMAFTTTRQGGMGRGNYAEFNITHYCGDDPEVVKQNRMALCKLLDIEDNRLILPRQTHNTEICCVDENFLNLTAEERCEALEGVDAVVTNLPGICIGVSTADCIPVLIYDTVGHVVCAVHAGWRGTMARIVEKAIATMSAFYGSRPENIVAQIGPGIHIDDFEVGDEVYEAFLDADFDMLLISRHEKKWHIDLPQCNRLQILSCGVSDKAVFLSPICTYEHPDTHFSARRLGIQSGRLFSGIMVNAVGG